MNKETQIISRTFSEQILPRKYRFYKIRRSNSYTETPFPNNKLIKKIKEKKSSQTLNSIKIRNFIN